MWAMRKMMHQQKCCIYTPFCKIVQLKEFVWCWTDQVQVGSLGQQLDVGTTTLDARLETDFVPSIRDRWSDEDSRHSDEKLEEAVSLTGQWAVWCWRRMAAAEGQRWRDVWLETWGQDLYLRAAYCPSSLLLPIYLPTEHTPVMTPAQRPRRSWRRVLTVVLGDVFVGILLLGTGHHPAEEDRRVTDTRTDESGRLHHWPCYSPVQCPPIKGLGDVMFPYWFWSLVGHLAQMRHLCCTLTEPMTTWHYGQQQNPPGSGS